MKRRGKKVERGRKLQELKARYLAGGRVTWRQVALCAGLTRLQRAAALGLASGLTLGRIPGFRNKQLAWSAAKCAARRLGLEQLGFADKAPKRVDLEGASWSREDMQLPCNRAALRRAMAPLSPLDRRQAALARIARRLCAV